jgi:hypothetical protein
MVTTVSPTEVKLTPEQREKLLRNIWLEHDGRWLLKAAHKFGFDTANKLNLSVQESIGKTETRQLLDEAGFAVISNIQELKELVELTCLLYTPESHETEVKVISNNMIVLYTRECYVHKMVSKAGNLSIHQCSSRIRCHSWLRGMGLNSEVYREKDIHDCRGACDIVFKINW